ncbi:8-oxo-dGTP diphosphatase [Elasticomyces elasticus]|nr:8-oxo-dGTP diphosphatase [Elasticomyces elasticus]
MASLSPAAAAALARLRAYHPPATQWYKLPLVRRAAVLILLFADKKGELRVVLTIRSAGLKNYAGQAALPGGKADTLSETPWTTARREAFEEIGLSMTNEDLPSGYVVEHLTELPSNLAMTELGVRPCVGYLKAPAPRSPLLATGDADRAPDVARDLLPKLDAKEVAAVFTSPFHNFLRSEDEDVRDREGERKVPGQWYNGSWHSWHESPWRMHQFYVPVKPSTVFRAKTIAAGDAAKEDDPRPSKPKHQPKADKATPSSQNVHSSSSSLQPPLPSSTYQVSGNVLDQRRYRVFGMTARILVDCARVAYGEEPDFEHNSHFGDEDMIGKLMKAGRLGPERKHREVLTRDVMVRAAKLS